MIVPPSIAREIAGVTQDFWERQLAQGKLLGAPWIARLTTDLVHRRIEEGVFDFAASCQSDVATVRSALIEVV
jgi:hypothetical protein